MSTLDAQKNSPLFHLGLTLTLSLILLLGLLLTMSTAQISRGTGHTASCLARLNDGDVYLTVQEAVDASTQPSDVIKVSGYCTHVNNYGGLAQVVYLSKTLTLRGSYTNTSGSASNLISYPATLDAQGLGRVLYVTGGISPTVEGLRITGGDSVDENGGGVYVTTATITISGCQVITNKAGGFEPFPHDGGGIYLHSSANATLIGNTIQGNAASNGGGVLLNYSANATLIDNIIQYNSAQGWYGTGGGGVLLIESDNATLSGNVIFDNTTAYGGGVYLFKSDNATLSNNTILSNTARSRVGSNGGGVWLVASANTILSGNTIQGNLGSAGSGVSVSDGNNVMLSGNIIQGNLDVEGYCWWRWGCGVHLSTSANVTLDNNVIADNQAGSGICVDESTVVLRHTTLTPNIDCDDSGVYVGNNGSTVWLTNTILVSHTVGISVTAGNTVTLQATLWGTDTWANTSDWGGAGVINTGTINLWGDPAFVDPDAGDYHIGFSSAARDAGVDAGVNSDIDGESRPSGAGFDMGADEYWPSGNLNYVYLPLTIRTGP